MSIVVNHPKAHHDYWVEERIEAGLVLEGWEVKALRSKRASILEAYVVLRRGQAKIIGLHISPLPEASRGSAVEAVRDRTLLLNAREIAQWQDKVARAGYTVVPLALTEVRGRFKVELGLSKGKKQYDKRQVAKERDWGREKARLMKSAPRQATSLRRTKEERRGSRSTPSKSAS